MSCNSSTEKVLLEEYDVNLYDFIHTLFDVEPKLRMTYDFTFPEEINVKETLAYFTVLGAKKLYNKQLAELSPSEIEHLRCYLQSIGWDVEYKIEQRIQQFDNIERNVNYYLIDFVKLLQ